MAPNVVGIITWMHTFSPAKMWIAGLCALDKPMLHFHTQANTELPWATIDFDFMNLNQAAHGDREFGYIETRLGIAAHDRGRPRLRPHRDVADRRLVSRRVPAGSRRGNMSVARFGDNMRYVAVTEGDKTEAEAIFGSQINTWGVMDLATLVESATDAQIDDADRRSTSTSTTSCRASCPAPSGTSRCGTARRSRSGCVSSSRRAASARSPHRSRTSARCVNCPASPCSG